MKNCLLLVFILIVSGVQAQFKNFSIRVAANYPAVKSVDNTTALNGIAIDIITGPSSYRPIETTVKQSFNGKVGIDAGFRFDYQFSKRFFISSGLMVQSIGYQRVTDISEPGTFTTFYISTPTDLGTPVGLYTEPTLPVRFSEVLGNTRVWNLQLPLLVGTYVANKRIALKAGPAFSYLMSVSQVKLHTAGLSAVSTYEDTSKDSFRVWQASAVVECSFYVTKHIGLDVTAQHFFTPTYAGDAYVSSGARFNTISMGASFMF